MEAVLEAKTCGKNAAESAVKRIIRQSENICWIPAMPWSGAAFAKLSEKGRRNTEVLALLAQQDPVFLARLLCAADLESNQNLTEGTALEAVGILGRSRALAIMLEHVVPGQCGRTRNQNTSLLNSAMHFVTRRCLTYVMTARRLARYLRLDSKSELELQLLCLLDCMGLYAAVYAENDAADCLRKECLAYAQSPSYSVRKSPLFLDYHLLSAQVAAQWFAPRSLIDALMPGSGSLQMLFSAVESVVDAKLRRTSQLHALTSAFGQHASLAAKVRTGEIDLVAMK